jgi:GT2 family glycosyltransferase/glycosyltransferase involved in cell wall biosynthesis
MPGSIPPLSICFFSHSSQLAGAERSLLELITELIRDHETICSVVLPDNGPLKEKLEQVGASTLIIDYSWWCDFNRPTIQEINSRLNHSLKQLLERIKEELIKLNPDVVFTNTMVIPWGAVTASLLGKPHVWFVHEFGELDYDFKFYLPFQRILAIIGESSNLVLANSNAVRRTLFGKTHDKRMVTINHHIDIPCDTSGQEDRHNYFIRADSTKLIITGVIAESKGQEDAILAVKELVQRKKDIELIIMGGHSPWYLGELKKIVRDENLEEDVRFHEFCENPYSVVSQADIVLVCSKYEAFGRVTAEAMLLKKPVIGTRSGGTTELIKEEYNGLLYEPGNYIELADKIHYLIEAKEKIREFGENGFKFAKENFTRQEYGGKIYQLLKDLKTTSNPSSSPYLHFIADRMLDLQATFRSREEVLTAERERFIRETARLQAIMTDQQALLLEIRQEVDELQQSMKDERQAFAEKEAEFNRIVAEKGLLNQELQQLQSTVEQKSEQLAEQEVTLLRIYQSHGWKALAVYYRVRNGLVPEGTHRRVLAKKLFHAVLSLPRMCSVERLGFWRFVRSLYRKLPLSYEEKQKLKSRFFTRTKFLTENTQAYKYWYQHQGQFLEQQPETETRQISRTPNASELWFPVASGTPQVSIIIPVYNELDFTLRCLKSIQDNPSTASAEIIVLDDASKDDTSKILPSIPGIRYIRNQDNLGFLRSCNRVASEARGEYLVFLNNDTEVQENWLDHMIAVFERERIGIVGAKLIYPNGRLQEAGGLIWSDGSAMNFGRDDDPRKPAYSYLRDTDYCSAACIVIKARLFQEVNGFDELFAPAYYEDVDLAFKVRAKGYRVLCQPAAKVTHFEGGTCGTDLCNGVKSYQQINAKKFLTKWSEVLKEHYSPENGDLVLAKDRFSVGRCLFVDVWPTPDMDAGSIYTIYLVKLFQHFSYKVTFFPGNTTRHFGKYTEDLQQMGVECLYEPFVTSLGKYLEHNGHYFDVVVLCRAAQAIGYFDDVHVYCPKAKVIFHTVDLHFLREERAARIRDSAEELKRALQLKKDELDICRKANCTLVPSVVEASLLAKEVPSAYVECFPFSPGLPGRKKSFVTRQNIGFLAGYLHEPNVDAITYFVREIWPHISERLPHVQFLMAGSNMPESVSCLAGDRVKAIGYVEDLAQFMENCRLTVAPLRFGAGIKGKVITSLAHGVPVVASPLAVEGMGCEHGVHLLVAETIAEWTESVTKAYTNKDLWEYLSDNGLALMRETYSLEAGFPRLQTLLHRLECPLPTDLESSKKALKSSPNPSNGLREITVIEKPIPDEVPRNALEAEIDKVRAIAFYLPQYHPIPENDKWWGKGFTEWTYVTRAKALFPGHYQPHLPSELGFYDLRLEEVREAQAVLAREHGIYGFCYHYYWFGGKRLLDRPLSEMLTSGRPNFPFCICWANENWTRRWDGRDQEILVKQEYSPGGDLTFIQELIPFLSDHRYIRVKGKPLLLVYRTESLPNAKRTAEIWREESIKAGIGDLYLCRVESFSAAEPESIGFDAACQFPPLLIGSPELDPVSVFNGTDSSLFKGKMFDYRGLAQQALNSEVYYKRFFGVTPSWDNTPRRGNNAYMWLNNSPGTYEDWLVRAVKNTLVLHHGQERLIFVNAWNEWGEGCHLEPDQYYGRASLEATRRALRDTGFEVLGMAVEHGHKQR